MGLMSIAARMMGVTVTEPSTYELHPTAFESMVEAIEMLKDGDTVIVDFSLIEEDCAIRSYDYIGGAVCALGLDWDRIESSDGEEFYCYGDAGRIEQWKESNFYPPNVLPFPDLAIPPINDCGSTMPDPRSSD